MSEKQTSSDTSENVKAFEIFHRNMTRVPFAGRVEDLLELYFLEAWNMREAELTALKKENDRTREKLSEQEQYTSKVCDKLALVSAELTQARADLVGKDHEIERLRAVIRDLKHTYVD